ncbi:winged helix-turn-helix domain-containing protein [Oliverpabstia intestinalis]|uniref:winged helix-turn-helix domain-containing protein n=1 Tax=Oliverpabstia intestinalis TaxID=2606633 RepID=UPI002E25B601
MIEFNDQDSSVFDEVMTVLKHHSAFEQLRFNEEDVLSLPGLEIYPDRRKIYRNRREINLTAKEYDLLCLLVANKGRVLTYEQIYQRIWGEEPLGNET